MDKDADRIGATNHFLRTISMKKWTFILAFLAGIALATGTSRAYSWVCSGTGNPSVSAPTYDGSVCGAGTFNATVKGTG